MRTTFGFCLLLLFGVALRGAEAHYVKLDPELVEKGTFTVGLALSGRPFAYREDGELKGFEVAIAKAVAEAHGLKLALRQLPRAGLRAALEAGEVDAINSLPLKGEIEGLVQLPYLQVGDHAIRLRGNPFRIGGTKDLSGRTVAVTAGTTAESFAHSLSTDLKEAGGKAMDIHSFPSQRHTHIPVSMGHAAVYFVQSVSAIAISRDPESRLELVEGVFRPEREVGFALRSKDSNVYHAVEHALAAAVATGKYEGLLEAAGLPNDLSVFKR